MPTLRDSLILPICLKIVKIFRATWSNLKAPPAALSVFKSVSVRKVLLAVSSASAALHSATFCRWSRENLPGFVRRSREYFSFAIRLRESMKELILGAVSRPRRYLGSASNSPWDKCGKWAGRATVFALVAKPTRFFGALNSAKLKFSLSACNSIRSREIKERHNSKSRCSRSNFLANSTKASPSKGRRINKKMRNWGFTCVIEGKLVVRFGEGIRQLQQRRFH